MRRLCFIIITILLTHLEISAQNSNELGFLPSLNVNKKLPNDWSINFKSESRQSLVKDDFKYEYLLTDISLAASKKVGINTAVSLGYLVRLYEGGSKNRIQQQITLVQRLATFRLSHRFLADQTFSNDEDTEFRLRYRISSEIPLQGKSLDPNEFFIKLNNEYLNSWHEKSYDLEIRLASYLGYVVSPANKLELGLDYRADSFIEGNQRNRFWIGLNIYLSI